MIKSNKNNNTLIKRNNLIKIIKKEGIKRVNLEAIKFFEKSLQEKTIKLIKIIKQEITASGKKTLNKKHIELALRELNKNREEFWEI